MDRGDLVPDSVILGILGEELAQPQYAKGVILDGAVRTVPQAEGWSEMLARSARKVDAVLAFDIDNDEIVRRLSDRTVCENCQTPYTGRHGRQRLRQVRWRARASQGRRAGSDPHAAARVRRRDGARARVVSAAMATRSSSSNAVGAVDEITARGRSRRCES